MTSLSESLRLILDLNDVGSIRNVRVLLICVRAHFRQATTDLSRNINPGANFEAAVDGSRSHLVPINTLVSGLVLLIINLDLPYLLFHPCAEQDMPTSLAR